MRKTAVMLLALSMSSFWLAGCGFQPDPEARLETNETRADRGEVMYSGFTAAANDRQVVTDLQHAVRGNAARSAHAMAYELESLSAVKGAAILVIDGIAYVGVRPSEAEALTPDERNLIEGKVLGTDRTIKRVLITDNTAAVDYLSDYTRALEDARPLGTYESAFSRVVRDTWPDAQETAPQTQGTR